MKLFQDALAGTLIIVTLVVAGVWFVRDPDCLGWPFSYVHGSPKETDLPKSTVNRIDWSAVSQKLLALFRGPENGEGCLALHDVRRTGWRPIESVGNSWATLALAIFHLKFSPEGTKLAAAEWEGTLHLYDVQTAAETVRIEFAAPERL
jgi:hypothetical protein